MPEQAVLPPRAASAGRATTGRGLLLVDALAAKWGVRTEGTGKVVWFDVARDGAGHR